MDFQYKPFLRINDEKRKIVKRKYNIIIYCFVYFMSETNIK